MQIRPKAILFIFTPTVFFLLVFPILFFISLTDYAKKNIYYSLTTQSQKNSEKISSYITGKTGIVTSLATLWGLDFPPNEVIQNILTQFTVNDDGINNVFFAFADGRFMKGDPVGKPPAGFDPRTRAWYKEALETNIIVYTPVYLHVKTRLPCVTISIPVKNGETIYGVLGIDFAIDEIGKIVAGSDQLYEGTSLLIDKAGTVIYHASSKVGENITESNEGAYKNVIEKLLAGEQIAHTSINTVPYIFTQIPAGKTNWIFINYVEEAQAFSALNTMKTFVLISIIIILGIFSVLFFFDNEQHY